MLLANQTVALHIGAREAGDEREAVPLPGARSSRSREVARAGRRSSASSATRSTPRTASRRASCRSFSTRSRGRRWKTSSTRSRSARWPRRSTPTKNIGHYGLALHALHAFHVADPPVPRPGRASPAGGVCTAARCRVRARGDPQTPSRDRPPILRPGTGGQRGRTGIRQGDAGRVHETACRRRIRRRDRRA